MGLVSDCQLKVNLCFDERKSGICTRSSQRRLSHSRRYLGLGPRAHIVKRLCFDPPQPTGGPGLCLFAVLATAPVRGSRMMLPPPAGVSSLQDLDGVRYIGEHVLRRLRNLARDLVALLIILLGPLLLHLFQSLQWRIGHLLAEMG